VSDLVGCAVFDGERQIGQVKDVRFGAGEAPLLLVEGAKEYEIPFAEAYLKGIDLDRNRFGCTCPKACST